ncbi:MAG: hypothetical protein JSV62_12805 [Promethearchaeota archaeon]|nr:MAG: hypothetical protein JSV62_12805 [Candidatus Lokiarchaeota archaeon]
MKSKYIIFGLFIIGILFVGINYGYGFEDTAGEEGEEIPDDDGDGIDDTVEDENKRDIEIYIGECVVEIASIKRSELQKDIIDLRVGYNEYGLSVRVSYGTFIHECETSEEEDIPKDEQEILPQGGDYCEETVEYKLIFEVLFRGLVEFVDLNANGVLDEEDDEIISDYGFNSFQPIDYSLISISDDTNLHYLVFNTTDGVFAAHIYLVEEFVYVDEILISPTEVKIDIEITDYEYLEDNSQLALVTKLWSEEAYNEREETSDEKEGYATDEKDVVTNNNQYSGFFSWKETALIDGIEMDVLTKELEFECEDIQVLLICYPRGNHIYHDPKIGIFIGTSLNGNIPIIIITGVISVVAILSIGVIILKKRRIR